MADMCRVLTMRGPDGRRLIGLKTLELSIKEWTA